MTEVKNIRVREKVHSVIRKIAELNYRGIGDQVEYWAATYGCIHPEDKRTYMNIVAAEVKAPENGQTAKLGEYRPVRGFFCHACRRYVFPDPQVTQVMNKPSGGVVS